MVKLKVTAHLDEDRTLSPEDAENTIKSFCENDSNMTWIETEKYPLSIGGQSIKLVFMVDSELDYTKSKLSRVFQTGDYPLFHNLTVEMT